MQVLPNKEAAIFTFSPNFTIVVFPVLAKENENPVRFYNDFRIHMTGSSLVIYLLIALEGILI